MVYIVVYYQYYTIIKYFLERVFSSLLMNIVNLKINII